MKTYTIFDTRDECMTDEELRSQIIDCGFPEKDITQENIEDERQYMRECYAEDFWAEIKNLEPFPCYIEADLGLWYGRRHGWGVTSDLKLAIEKCIGQDMYEYRIEETSYGKLIVYGYHHDGTNVYTIYMGDRARHKNVHLRKLLGWI